MRTMQMQKKVRKKERELTKLELAIIEREKREAEEAE